MRYLIGTVFFLAMQAAAAPAPNLEALLKTVDSIRNPAESYSMRIEVESSDAPDGPSMFDVSISGNTRTLITTTAPPVSAGKKYLMIDQEIWAYTPNLGRPVRASLSQKLNGQASNGDISRMRWSGDYAPKLERAEGSAWVLLLTAKKKSLTYDKIRVWVDQKTFRPLKAEFLTLNGQVLKNATYGGYRQLSGKIRPTEVTIEDAKMTSNRSVIRIKAMMPRSFPDALFNQNSLK